MLIRFSLALAACLTIALAPQARAYEFSPIVAQFTPSGAGAARTFVVRNTHDEPIALQIEIYRRSANETGQETRQPEYDDFIVTPPQLVLAPGQSQSIRAQWIGEADPDMELSYRMVVEQLPIPYAKADAGDRRVMDVSLGLRYEAALYIVPADGEPRAEIVASEVTENEEGQPGLRLTVRNTGKRRAILQDPVLTVTAEGRTAQLEGDSVAVLDNRNIIAGTQAVVDLPWPEDLPVGPVAVSLKTSYYQN